MYPASSVAKYLDDDKRKRFAVEVKRLRKRQPASLDQDVVIVSSYRQGSDVREMNTVDVAGSHELSPADIAKHDIRFADRYALGVRSRIAIGAKVVALTTVTAALAAVVPLGIAEVDPTFSYDSQVCPGGGTRISRPNGGFLVTHPNHLPWWVQLRISRGIVRVDRDAQSGKMTMRMLLENQNGFTPELNLDEYGNVEFTIGKDPSDTVAAGVSLQNVELILTGKIGGEDRVVKQAIRIVDSTARGNVSFVDIDPREPLSFSLAGDTTAGQVDWLVDFSQMADRLRSASSPDWASTVRADQGADTGDVGDCRGVTNAYTVAF